MTAAGEQPGSPQRSGIRQEHNVGGVNIAVTGTVTGDIVVHLDDPGGQGRSNATSPPVRMIPLAVTTVIDRPAIIDQIMEALLRDDAPVVGVTAALHGAGGFGKTTVAGEICRDPQSAETFTGGILWVTIGEHCTGVALAEKINGLSELLSGRRPMLSDPEQAGYRFGELLDRYHPPGRQLLVVDDVWSAGQLRPLLSGGARCRRVVTTRVRSSLPLTAVVVGVDAMEPTEARALLTVGLDDLPARQRRDLLLATGRWPVLLSLVNAAIRRRVRNGATPRDAGAAALARMAMAGPTAFDIRRADQRDQAVARTIEASLDQLTPVDLDRYLSLAVVPDGVDVPDTALARLWGTAYEPLDLGEVEALCDEFADLSLVMRWGHAPVSLRLHDVVRAYLRVRMRARLRALHDALVAASRPVTDDSSATAGARWARLPEHDRYMWRHLPYHLAGAGRSDELAEVVCDLRFLVRKLELLGPLSVQTDLDLVDQPAAGELASLLRRRSHLLEPIEPRHALGATLLCDTGLSAELMAEADRYWPETGQAVLRLRQPPLTRPQPGLRQVVAGPDEHVRALAVTPLGDLLVTGADDGQARVYDLRTGQLRHRLEADPGWVCAVITVPGGEWVAVAGASGRITMWDAATGAVLRRWAAHPEWVFALAVSPDGTWLASGGADGHVTIWDAATGTALRRWAAHPEWVFALAVSPDGTWLASGGADGHLAAWETATGRLLDRWSGHDGWVLACDIDPGGTRVVSGGEDQTVRLWRLGRPGPDAVLQAHVGRVWGCVFAPDGRRFATAADDEAVLVWDTTVPEAPLAVFENGSKALAAAGAPGPDWLLTAAADGLVRRWDASVPAPTGGGSQSGAGSAGGAGAGHQRTLLRMVRCCAFAPDGGWAITAGDSNTVLLWDLADGTVRLTLPQSGWIYSCAVSPDGRLVATGQDDGSVWIWEVASASVVATIPVATSRIRSVLFTSEGDQLVISGDTSSVRVVDVATGLARHELLDAARWSATCALHPDGTRLVIGAHNGIVRTWEPTTGRVTEHGVRHNGPVRACTYLPDGTGVITGGADGAVHRMDLDATADQPPVGSYPGHDGEVLTCCVDTTSAWLATGGQDRTVRIWDVATGACRTALRVESVVHQCLWAPDGDALLVVGSAGVELFRLYP